MKTLIITIGMIFVIGFIGVGIWFFMSPKPASQTTGTGIAFPVATSTATGQTQPVPNQPEAAGTQPEISQAFLGQIQNSDLITLKGTTIVSTFALQTWGDENKGGEALLQYDSSRGWVLISMGGGAWSVSSLVSVGVPQSVAEQLISGRQ